METAFSPRRSQSPEREEGEPVEKFFVEMVNKRRMKVEKLEQVLTMLRNHITKLSESFSVPTFPEGYDPATERSGDEYLNDSIPSSRATASGSNQHQLPSSKARSEAGFADGGDIVEEAVPTRTVRNPTPAKIPSSSKSASAPIEARGFIDLTYDLDQIKDEIRKGSPGAKYSRKSLAKANGIAIRNPKKMFKTGPGNNDESESAVEGSSCESSDEEESPIESSGEESRSESSDEDESPTESPGEESPNESPDEKFPNESSDEESSGNEGSESAPEESDESDESASEIKPSVSNLEALSAQGISSSSASESLSEETSSPVKIRKSLSGEKARTTWQPKSKAPSSSSDDSEESSSSSDEDTVRNRHHAQSRRASLGRARKPEAPNAVLTLSSDASPEELFDWTILGLQGPWLPLASVENGPGASVLKDEALPLKFPSVKAYTATFQKLIGEEAKSILLSEWEKFKAEQESNTEQTLNVDSRGQSSVWRLQSMVRTMGDAFHYFEAESKQGPLKFDLGEFLCMIVPGTEEVKAVAIVYHQDRFQAPILRTRTPWDFSLDEVVLLRLCNTVTLRRMFLAVTTLSEVFSPLQQQILDPLANIKFLNPSSTLKDSAGGDPKPNLGLESLRNFSDRKILNTLQLLAVSSLLDMRQGFQLIQGPPGTGKTSTIVGMVSALLIEEPGVRILVCAPANAALDEIAVRLMHGMLDRSGNTYSPLDGSIVRFGAQRVMHPIVQLISLESLTLRLSSSSKRSRDWADILDGASVVCATLSGCGNHTFDELEKMFDVVIIDEAAQAVEAEVLIALKRVRGRCVIVGDPQQLPATVFQRPSVAFGRSLFERFQEGGNPVHMLRMQYRMHPSICIYPSKKFYGGALTNSSRTSTMQSIFSEGVCDRGITIRGCRFKLGHYCFMDVGWGTEREELVGHSRANFEEARVVCNVVEGAVKGLLPGRKPSVGVITPYVAQRGIIESQLGRRRINTSACEVNTVDGFQGREKDVIVLSCVRAMADRGLGFVSDEKRMNVALTRAKYSLIIVGHAKTLRKFSPAWDALIEDAMKRGCYQVLESCKNQDVPSSNRNQSPLPRKDLNDTSEVGHIAQSSRKRSLSSPEGVRLNKNEDLKPMTTDRKSSKKIEDSGKAPNDDEHTQMLSRNSETLGVEEKAVCKGRVKRKRKSFEVEDGKKSSEGLERAPNSGSAKAREDMLESSTVEKKVHMPANSPDSVIPPKKKKKKQPVKEHFPEPSVLGKNKVKVESDVTEPSATKKSPVVKKKKVKVESDVAEPSATKKSPVVKKKKVKVESDAAEPSATKKSPVLKKRKVKLEAEVAEPSVTKRTPIKLKASKQELPTAEMRKCRIVFCLPAPALPSPFKRRGTQTAKLVKDEPKSPPKPPTKETTSVTKEVTADEVTFSAPPCSAHTRTTSLDAKDNGKAQTRDSAPEDSIPQGTNNWTNTEAERQSRGWFPNSVPEDDRHIKQPHLGVGHSSLGASSTQRFANVDEQANIDNRQPHWRNSFEVAAPGPQRPFHAHELSMNTENMYSVLTRPDSYLGMLSNNHGNLQQGPQNYWQHPNLAQVSPLGHQFDGHPFSNFDHREPPWTQRQAHSAPLPPNKWIRSEALAHVPQWKPHQSHPGKQGHPGRDYPGRGHRGRGHPGRGHPGRGHPGRGHPWEGSSGEVNFQYAKSEIGDVKRIHQYESGILHK